MQARIDPCVLWVRAFFVGSIAFFLGVAGHVTAAGLLPGLVALTALLAFSVLLSLPMLRGMASPLRLAGMLVGGQTVVHLVLTVSAGHAGDHAGDHAAAPPRRAGLGDLPVVDGHRVGSLQDAYQDTYQELAGQPSMAPALPVGHLIEDLSAHAPMMAAHLAAAVLVGLWLGHGERCLWTLLALTGRRILAAALLLVPVVAALVRMPSYAADRAPAGPRSRWLVRPDSRRGPPLLAA